MTSVVLSPADAEDALNAVINTALTDPAVTTLLGQFGPLVLLWDGIEKAFPPNGQQYWIRVSHQSIISPQTTLNGCVPGQRRFTTSGLTFLQLFAPTADKQYGRKALLLATIARDCLRTARLDTVLVRNARINKLTAPLENDQYRLNVVAEHEYDELG